ncbi:reverse transcriptase domain-containing protein [Artemisia annua]|uniref:Reverse transcriptase domain-containing protein n=1 Tax=Artemisia annua TaxID=35608 RepID=A0A2U1M3D8_ARTAN|nr:reverse transcriptase domain-containing protein [Artemisia annua]
MGEGMRWKGCERRVGGEVEETRWQKPPLVCDSVVTKGKGEQWADAPFQRWKECMEILPTFTVPDRGEALFLHLATPSGGISVTLLAKRIGIYIPIYFSNRTLQEIERTYTRTERLILALVNAARCLRKYFQEHPMRVLTNKPIRRILSQPDRSRRIVKWALELEEYSIEYQKEDLTDGQMPISVLSTPNQVVRITTNQSFIKSLRSGENGEAPNLFVPDKSEPPTYRNMKVSEKEALKDCNNWVRLTPLGRAASKDSKQWILKVD